MLGVLKHGVAETMANDIGRRTARGCRSRRPELPGLLIAKVERLARGVLNGIVAPRRQPKFVGVFRPSVSAAAFRNHRAKKRIGEHVDPWGWSRLPGLKGDDIFMAIAGKTAEAVLEDELSRRDGLR